MPAIARAVHARTLKQVEGSRCQSASHRVRSPSHLVSAATQLCQDSALAQCSEAPRERHRHCRSCKHRQPLAQVRLQPTTAPQAPAVALCPSATTRRNVGHKFNYYHKEAQTLRWSATARQSGASDMGLFEAIVSADCTSERDKKALEQCYETIRPSRLFLQRLSRRPLVMQSHSCNPIARYSRLATRGQFAIALANCLMAI